MAKDITTIGFVIPANDHNELDFDDKTSLMDADVLLISPDSIRPSGHWVSFTSSDGGCYNVQASAKYSQTINHLKKEIQDHLKAGKTVFIFLTEEAIDTLSNGVSSPKKGQNTYNTYNFSNYQLLPFELGRMTSASGKYIQFSGNPIFNDFNSKFKTNLHYEVYIQDPKNASPIFTGKDSSKILGSIYKAGAGHLVTLPVLAYDRGDFIETSDEESYWNDKGLEFGKSLVKILLEIDKKLTSEDEKTPPPDWILNGTYTSGNEKLISDVIVKNIKEIENIRLKNEELEKDLKEEKKLKDLLFEQGKPLENAIIKALILLGYSAENYDDGKLEMDQVIISPEGNRYIGENEGKDNKDINITKFRQLLDALNEDFAREEVKEKAFGILFGNAERLKDPNERTLDFTEKCKSGAEREKIALIRTVDIFVVAKYLSENKNEEFSKSCRDALHNCLGKIVEFPPIPSK